jgi:hypothetical protein
MTIPQAELGPAYELPEYTHQSQDLCLVTDCLEGASAIKRESIKYLPKQPEESAARIAPGFA